MSKAGITENILVPVQVMIQVENYIKKNPRLFIYISKNLICAFF